MPALGGTAAVPVLAPADGTVRGSTALRVPSAALFATVEELDALAVAVPVRRIDERDVTSESTDVRETTTRPEDLLTVFERIRWTLTVFPIGLLPGAPGIVAVVVWRRVCGTRTTPAPTGPVMGPDQLGRVTGSRYGRTRRRGGAQCGRATCWPCSSV
jgi:hypothetical protein